MSKKKESKESDFLFVGPMAAGKTCIMKALSGGTAPDFHLQSGIEKGKRGFIVNPKKLYEIGGRQINNHVIIDYMRSTKNICFVFNGIELLGELNNWEKGGINTSFLTHWYRESRKIEDSGSKNCHIWFIATHKDEYKGDDMVKDIIQATHIANDKYKEIAGSSSKRYIYHDSLNGALFAVNAMKKSDVIDIYCKIKSKG